MAETCFQKPGVCVEFTQGIHVELVKKAVNIDITGTDLCPREAKDKPRTMSLIGDYTVNSEIVDGDSTSAISPMLGNLPILNFPAVRLLCLRIHPLALYSGRSRS